MKFGRRDGQWKFVGNTPSPEKEEVELPVSKSSPAPLEGVQVDAGQSVEQQVMLATPPMEVIAPVPTNGYSPILGDISNAQVNGSTNLEVAGPNKADTGTTNEASTSSLHGDSPFRHEEPLPLSIGRNGQIADPELVRDQTASGAVQTFARSPSPSVVSATSQPSAAESEDSEEKGKTSDSASDAVWRGSASDFGLDGAVMSSLRQTVQPMGMASEIGRRWVEMQEVARVLNQTKTRFPPSDSKTLETSQKATHTKTGHTLQSESCKPQDEVQHGANVIVHDHHVEPSEHYGKGTLVIEDGGRDVRIEDADTDESFAANTNQTRGPEALDQAMSEGEVQLDRVADLDEKSDINDPEQPRPMARGEKAIDGNPDEKNPFVAAEVQDSPPGLEASMGLVHPQAEVTNLESEDDKDSQKYPQASIDRSSSYLVHGDFNQHGDNRPVQRADFAKHNDYVPKEHEVRIEKLAAGADVKAFEANNNEHNQADAARGPLAEHPSSHQAEGDAVIQQQRPVTLTHIADDQSPLATSPENIAPGSMDERVAPLQPTSNTTTENASADFETPLSLQALPSTVQDTYEDPFTTQVSITSDSQHMDILDESHTLSTLPALADEISPTPDPAQANSTGTESPEPKDLREVDFPSTQDQSSGEVVADTQAEGYDASAVKKLQAQPSPMELVEEGEALPREPPAEAERSHKSTPESKAGILVSNTVDQTSPMSQGSSLIARLKEMRRLSSQKPRTQLSGNSTRPWFAPRCSSDAERDANSSSTGRTEKISIKTPTKSTPEKREKRLSQSFIRSSPLPSPSSKSPTLTIQESQYLPSSQVATGFRTNLSYFVPLASLHNHYGTTVDILVIAISSTPISRAKSGPKDYNQTLYLSDPSSASSRSPTTLTTAQIFRLRKLCFPTINSGDAVLLRNFKVQSFQKALSLISTDDSAWAIFREDADIQIRGPPVEYGPEERAFARAHRNWWASLDAALRDRLVAAVPKTTAGRAKKGLGFELPSSQSPKPAKSSDRSVGVPTVSSKEQSLRSGGFPKPEDIKQEDEGKAATQRRRGLRPRQAQGQASASPEKDDLLKVEEIHELRDGTRYVDRQGVGVEDVEAQRGVHELRDGTTYRARVE